jgi:hypothetical protein
MRKLFEALVVFMCLGYVGLYYSSCATNAAYSRLVQKLKFLNKSILFYLIHT